MVQYRMRSDYTTDRLWVGLKMTSQVEAQVRSPRDPKIRCSNLREHEPPYVNSTVFCHKFKHRQTVYDPVQDPGNGRLCQLI